jgi:hypothetical protein
VSTASVPAMQAAKAGSGGDLSMKILRMEQIGPLGVVYTARYPFDWSSNDIRMIFD